jgi:hypothetical protein
VRRVEHYPVTLKGGPRDGETIQLSWEQVKSGRIEVPVQSGGLCSSFKRAFYVPCPTEPDSVWRLDSRRSDRGAPLDSRKVCRVTEVSDRPSALFGINVSQVSLDSVMDALYKHYNDFGQAPERFSFPEGAAVIAPELPPKFWDMGRR